MSREKWTLLERELDIVRGRLTLKGRQDAIPAFERYAYYLDQNVPARAELIGIILSVHESGNREDAVIEVHGPKEQGESPPNWPRMETFHYEDGKAVLDGKFTAVSPEKAPISFFVVDDESI